MWGSMLMLFDAIARTSLPTDYIKKTGSESNGGGNHDGGHDESTAAN